ncbi:MAG: protocatechuate 3,4-dioxygenase subunit beta [Alphaproteobacteria bacterium]|nr:protocatechuate 3,4-dioxygenase subunit beta [Alphaproteobacteria bacterium]
MAETPYNPRDWETQPAYLVPEYKSTITRSPGKPLIPLPQSLSEITGPVFGHETLNPLDNDLTRNGAKDGGEPLGERIIVTGRVLDENARPQPNTLIEIWQCNAAGRYIHAADLHDAPLDPNFFGGGRCVTDENGVYKFTTVKPAAYPWGNHANAWRPAHIHFSLFGPAFVTRLVTQSYFPGDPLLELDPIFNATPIGHREMLVKKFSLDATEEGFALGYEFDFVLRGRRAAPMEG